ncbi:uncharacterized protein LOC131228695 [Magnolia sinica]|uniref:uncharacterized protein LOC131228695 n=1 Tax=Magnolia sinica TaxID=86752 RepID=UPI00265B3426|nr:uncharacterized protein LOC131228695 [Magnolia sinica]
MGRMTETAPPPQSHHPIPITSNNYIILPSYYPPPYFSRSRAICRRVRSFSLSILLPISLLALALFFFWPSQPDLHLSRLRLEHISFSTHKSSSSILPSLSIDVSLDLTVKVRNKDFLSLDYGSILVSIGYRGRQLGYVTSAGGHIRARGSSYVNATLQLDGVEILHDVLYLIEDMARGSIPFDTVTEIQGQLGLLFFDFPIQTKVSCEVYVNTDNQTIVRQDCYPE